MNHNDFNMDNQFDYSKKDYSGANTTNAFIPKKAKEDNEPEKIAEAKRRWKKLQKLVKKDRQFVLLIGLAGAAKTVITSSMVYASMVRHGINFNNISESSEGAAYFSKMITPLLRGEFPAGTGVFDLEYFDTTIYYNGKKMPVTFIEMSGENLARFNPEDAEKNEFFKEFTAFLSLNPKLITFLVAPANHKTMPPVAKISEKISSLDLFFHMCIDRLRSINKGLTDQMGLIISKWDTLDSSRLKIDGFIKKNYPITWQHIRSKNNINHSKYFKFSIGKVSADGSKIEDKLCLKDCYPILDWIYELVVTRPATDELEKVEDKLENVDRRLDDSKNTLRKIGEDINELPNQKPKVRVSWSADMLRKIAQFFVI